MAWWTSRPAIALASGVIGLSVGAGMNASADTGALTKKVDALADQRSDLKSQVLQLKDSAVDQSEIDQQVADAVEQAETDADAAQEAAVAAAVTKERQRAARLVAAAKKSATTTKPSSSPSSSGGGTDPRFRTCGDANDAGYGPYRQGADPEYDWYQDRDSDGVVCES